MWMKNWEALTQHKFYGLLLRICTEDVDHYAVESAGFAKPWNHPEDNVNVNLFKA